MISSPAGECQSLVPLARMEHYVFWIDHVCELVVVRRTAEPFSLISDIAVTFLAVERALFGITRSEYRLLVDVRGRPSRNDPEFEEEIAKHRGKLVLGFAKNAALATSA